MSGQTHPGVARWHAYMDSGSDLGLLSAMVADDAVFHSPVVHTPQEGAVKVMAYLGAAAKVLGNDSFRYVRVPGQKRTYAAKVNVELSTRFSDWIETNLSRMTPT